MESKSYHEFETRKRLPDPNKSALLVIDMQNYFSSMATPILSVIFTRHRHKPGDDGGVLGEWWNGELVVDGTPESELIPEVVQAADTAEMEVVEKETYSAFRNTRLEERLRELGVEEVIVTGVMTNVCCETTAREAFVRGFRVFFSTDATATSSHVLHEATLVNMAFGFAYLVDYPRLKSAF